MLMRREDKALKKKREVMIPKSAVDQMMDIACAWISVLMRRLGTGVYRISMADIREGLGKYRFSAVREGDTYVVRLDLPEGADMLEGGEDACGGETP